MLTAKLEVVWTVFVSPGNSLFPSYGELTLTSKQNIISNYSWEITQKYSLNYEAYINETNYLCVCVYIYIYIFFFSNATTCSYELRGFPSCLWRQCSWLLRLRRPWGTATLPQWCGWWYVYEDEVPGWALKSKSTNYPDHDHHGDLPLPGKIPMVEPGIEPWTSWLVVRNLDHYTTRLVYLCIY